MMPNKSLHWTGSSRFSLFQWDRRWRLLPASELRRSVTVPLEIGGCLRPLLGRRHTVLRWRRSVRTLAQLRFRPSRSRQCLRGSGRAFRIQGSSGPYITEQGAPQNGAVAFQLQTEPLCRAVCELGR
jgi:hypothetical protein